MSNRVLVNRDLGAWRPGWALMCNREMTLFAKGTHFTRSWRTLAFVSYLKYFCSPAWGGPRLSFRIHALPLEIKEMGFSLDLTFTSFSVFVILVVSLAFHSWAISLAQGLSLCYHAIYMLNKCNLKLCDVKLIIAGGPIVCWPSNCFLLISQAERWCRFCFQLGDSDITDHVQATKDPGYINQLSWSPVRGFRIRNEAVSYSSHM